MCMSYILFYSDRSPTSRNVSNINTLQAVSSNLGPCHFDSGDLSFLRHQLKEKQSSCGRPAVILVIKTSGTTVHINYIQLQIDVLPIVCVVLNSVAGGFSTKTKTLWNWTNSLAHLNCYLNHA